MPRYVTHILQALLAESVQLGLLLFEDLHILQLLVHGEAALIGSPGLLPLFLHGRGGLAVGLGSGLVLLEELLLLALWKFTHPRGALHYSSLPEVGTSGGD